MSFLVNRMLLAALLLGATAPPASIAPSPVGPPPAPATGLPPEVVATPEAEALPAAESPEAASDAVQPPTGSFPPAAIADPNAVDEIMRIRRRIGDPFRGTLLETAGDGKAADFASSMQSVIGQHRGKSSSECEAQYRQQVEREQLSGEASLATTGGLGAAPSPAPPALPVPAELVSQLRDTARQLGRRADDLEELEDYATADRLRDLAQQLRLEARQRTRSWPGPQATRGGIQY